MIANVKGSEWTDPDDAPELGDEFFEGAKRLVDGQEVTEEQFQAAKKRMGRPPVEVKRTTLNER